MITACAIGAAIGYVIGRTIGRWTDRRLRGLARKRLGHIGERRLLCDSVSAGGTVITHYTVCDDPPSLQRIHGPYDSIHQIPD